MPEGALCPRKGAKPAGALCPWHGAMREEALCPSEGALPAGALCPRKAQSLRGRYAQEKAQLKSRMEKELTDQGDPRMLGNGHVFDQYPYSDARTAQFYNRYLSGVPLKAASVNPTDFESEDVDD